MLKLTILIIGLLSISASCKEQKKHRGDDLDWIIANFWPWNQMVKVAFEDTFDEPKVKADDKTFEIKMNVKKFKPDELRVKVKNRYVIVEGKHKETTEHSPAPVNPLMLNPFFAHHFVANHFVQRFALPPGCKQEEVTAVLNENAILVISAPRHEVPPPPPEREVPIEVRLPVEVTTEKKDEKEVVTTEAQKENDTKKIEKETKKPTPEPVPVETSSATPLEQLDLEATTTHVGKIRKKELKPTTKNTKDNEVSKGVNDNGLDYALIDNEE